MESENEAPRSSEFGAVLRRHRLAAGLSQEALAERARMSIEGVSALERGYRRTPQHETLELLAGALALDENQRRAFEAAAIRSASPRRSERETSVTVGPWSDGGPSSLPFAIATFIGRERELGEIASLVRNHRLITITGAGGVGKTQTALRVARNVCDGSHIAGCFVGLASSRDPSLVTAAIASALGVQQMPRRALLDALIAYLKPRTILLFLDNCEHVVQEAANVAEALLAACPGLRIVATSREALMAAGERRYRLPPLGSADAIALFADRAQGVDVHFALSNESAPLVAEICRRLDGIPLAIELAAARINVLSLEALSEKLDDRFRILSGARRSELQHRTMRAAIDWSYNLLSEPERRVFERLSVVAGGCTLAAANSICSGDEVSKDEVFELLASLVDKSLVTVDFERSEPRYGLLDASRQYAHEKAASRGEMPTLLRRHAFAYLELAEWLQVKIRSAPVEVWHEVWLAERDNWRTTLRWSLIERGDVALGLALAGLLCLWEIFGLLERRNWTTAALRLVDEKTPTRTLARLSQARGNIAFELGDFEDSLDSHRIALSYYRELGDPLAVAGSQSGMAYAMVSLGRPNEARIVFEEALPLARTIEGHGVAASILSGLALVADDIALVRSYTAAALKHSEATGNTFNTAYALINLSSCELRAGDAESALAHASEALAAARGLSAVTERTEALNNISLSLIALARFHEADQYARELLALAREHGLDRLIVSALERVVVTAVLRLETNGAASPESLQAAARILGFVDSRIVALESIRESLAQAHYERVGSVIVKAMGTEAFAELAAAGAASSEPEAIAQALSL
jgi:predicted ATPase